MYAFTLLALWRHLVSIDVNFCRSKSQFVYACTSNKYIKWKCCILHFYLCLLYREQIYTEHSHPIEPSGIPFAVNAWISNYLFCVFFQFDWQTILFIRTRSIDNKSGIWKTASECASICISKWYKSFDNVFFHFLHVC